MTCYQLWALIQSLPYWVLPNRTGDAHPFLTKCLWLANELPMYRSMKIFDKLWLAGMQKWKVKVKVAQSCLTLCDPVDYTVHGILQARILEWVAVPFSRGSSQPTQGSNPSLPHCRRILYYLSHKGSPQGCKVGYNSLIKSYKIGLREAQAYKRPQGCTVLSEKGCRNCLVMSAVSQGEGIRGVCVTHVLSVPNKCQI